MRPLWLWTTGLPIPTPRHGLLRWSRRARRARRRWGRDAIRATTG